MIVLDGKAYAKKEREEREGFQIDADHQYPIERAIEWRAVTPNRQELPEDRDPEYGDDVDCHDPEQGNAARTIDRCNAIRRRYRAGERRRVAQRTAATPTTGMPDAPGRRTASRSAPCPGDWR